MDYRTIIQQWPTQADLARDMGLQAASVYKWHERGNIPAQYWLDLVSAARRRKIRLTIKDLAKAAIEARA